MESPRNEPLGNAKWSSYTGVTDYEALTGDSFFFGYGMDAESDQVFTKRLYSSGVEGHFLTLAQTRAGKGVSLIIPNLLYYGGSALVIDPKGRKFLVNGVETSCHGTARL
jgi:type IV secretion system protein VirD4